MCKVQERISDKINEINQYLQELTQILPSNFEAYNNSLRDKAACERYFEKIIEATVDLGFMVIKSKQFEVPDTDKGVFLILKDHGLISAKIQKKLNEAKGMRNILAHEYGKVNDKLIYQAVCKELIPDITLFLKEINEALK